MILKERCEICEPKARVTLLAGRAWWGYIYCWNRDVMLLGDVTSRPTPFWRHSLSCSIPIPLTQLPPHQTPIRLLSTFFVLYFEGSLFWGRTGRCAGVRNIPGILEQGFGTTYGRSGRYGLRPLKNSDTHIWVNIRDTYYVHDKTKFAVSIVQCSAQTHSTGTFLKHRRFDSFQLSASYQKRLNVYFPPAQRRFESLGIDIFGTYF